MGQLTIESLDVTNIFGKANIYSDNIRIRTKLPRWLDFRKQDTPYLTESGRIIEMSISLLPHAVIKVSSVLNRETKQYGKNFMFDDKSDTCWNSDQGTPQWISLDFTKTVDPTEIQIQFQGGFAGKDCSVEVQLEGQHEITKLQQFYPEDINSLQIFPIATTIAGEWSPKNMRIVFNNSTDFFGRIVIYKLDILGELRSWL